MKRSVLIFALLCFVMFAACAYARGGAAGTAGHTHAETDLGGEYVDEDESSTDDLGAEDLDDESAQDQPTDAMSDSSEE